MLFNLEPGDTLYSDKHRVATVKVNDKEGNVQRSIRVKLRDCKQIQGS